MGCFWSSEERREREYRRASRNQNIPTFTTARSRSCPPARTPRARPVGTTAPVRSGPRPRFGEYLCSCGRHWCSRLSWADRYQVCKKCRRQVYPFKQRDLLASDLSNTKENLVEHQKELCQMCQQLGHYCGSFAKGGNNKKI